MKPPFPTAVPESAETGVERLGGKMEQRFGFHLPDGKKAGVWRLEGKTYIVEDGDIISIRAGA